MEKLFYQDTHITDFKATVLQCLPDDRTGQYKIVLDCTAFFPEGGGQPSDLGSLTADASYRVFDVQSAGDVIYHFLPVPLTAGQTVTGHVDAARRLDFMQQHTGEHIISGLVRKHYGYDNVGFHLNSEEVVFDFNGQLTVEQLRQIEAEANHIVRQNLPVKAFFPQQSLLSTLDYRSKLELTENVRIVEIPGVDCCACCAPHVDTTGQIGLIKITNVQSHRGGVRINLLCGARALADYTRKQDAVAEISALLSARQDAVSAAVKRLMAESLSHKERANALQAALLSLEIQHLPSPSETDTVLLFTGDLDNIALRNAVNSLTGRYKGYCCIFAGTDDGGYRFIAGSSAKDCTALAEGLRQTFRAKCGGAAPMIQGSLCAAKADIQTYFCRLQASCK